MTEPAVDNDKDEIPRQSVFALMPRRSVARILTLLALLVGVVLFQRNSAGCANQITQTLVPGAPAQPRPGGTSPGAGAPPASPAPQPKPVQQTP